eukprot:6465986-Lingulodinium_polyedra.AAC.1
MSMKSKSTSRNGSWRGRFAAAVGLRRVVGRGAPRVGAIWMKPKSTSRYGSWSKSSHSDAPSDAAEDAGDGGETTLDKDA